MPADAATCSRAFAGTALAGYEVVAGNGGTLLVRDLPGDRLLELWHTARDVLDETGRWPVAATSWSDEDEDPWIGDVAAADIAEFAAEAARADPWRTFGWTDDYPVEPDFLRHVLAHWFPRTPDLAERMLTDLGTPTTRPAWDRWLYDALLHDPALRDQVDVTHLQAPRQWHRLESFTLVLLPTGDGWLSRAWLGYHGALDPPRAHALAAAEREWHERWGAEVVASWETMLQLIVRRPPQDPEDCWELAGQLKDVGGSLQMYRYELALALAGSDAWFLHDRP